MEEETKRALAKKRMQIVLNTRDEFIEKIAPYMAEEVSGVYKNLDNFFDIILSLEAKFLVSVSESS